MLLGKSAIIIVHFCAYDECVRCVRSLLSQSTRAPVIFVIDNNSHDSSGERLAAEFKGEQNVEVICSPENRGYAGAANIGLAVAKKRGYDFGWIITPDIVVDANALAALTEAAQEAPDAALFGSRVLYLPQKPEEKLKIWGAGGVVDVSSMTVFMLGSGEPDGADYDLPRYCDYLPGCSLFVRLSMLNELGYLPENYFLYFEETDWCMRARACGYKLRYVPNSIVFHDASVERMQAPMRVYYFNRASQFFWWRWSGPLRKLQILARSLFVKAPQAMWAFLWAPNLEYKKTFLAHFYAQLDFLRRRQGQACYEFIESHDGVSEARTETL